MQKNGEISGVNLLCEIVQCDSFGPFPNGALFLKNNTLIISKAVHFDTSILTICDNGFELRGSAERKCLGNGSWSGMTPICERIRCKNQTILKDLYQQNRAELFFGDEFIAVYNSNQFYLVNGSLDVVCAADGNLKWAKQQPYLAFICKVQKNGHFRAETSHCLVDDKCEVGNAITFECSKDFQMMQINATCLSNHTWSSASICTRLSELKSSGPIIWGSAAVGVVVIASVIAFLLYLYKRKLHKSKSKTLYEKPDEPKEDLHVYSEINETQKTDRKKGDDAALSTSNSYLTAVVTDDNYYESVCVYESIE